MKKLGGNKPALSFGVRMPGQADGAVMEVLPFRRSWPAIAFMAVFTGVFAIPLFTLPLRLDDNQDLFDLTANLFTLFWALGWLTGVAIMVLILLALLFAREVLIVTPAGIRQRIEILNIGLGAYYKREFISNLRYIDDGSIAGAAWRGKHLTFDYMQVPVSLGSALDKARATALCSRINAGLGQPVPLRLPETALAAMAQAESAAQDKQPSLEAHAGIAAKPAGNASNTLLVLANLVPLAGVFLLGWRVADIMLLFWFESAIVGFFNILKMFRIAGAKALFYSLFFVGHFGAFMAVHLMFIFGLFIEGNGPSASLPEVAAVFVSLWPAILGLFISHGFSYRENFIKGGEYERLTLKEQMHKPYTRIVLMHLTIIFGGFLTLILKAGTPALVLLIVLKVIVDLKAHGKEHRSGREEPG